MILINDNCLTYMKNMEDGVIDMTVTSPPYEDLRDYSGIEWNADVWQNILRELFRVTKPGGVCAWIVADKTKNFSESGESFRQALFAKEIGFCLYDTMIYQKDSPPCNDNRYNQDFEYIFIFSKGKPTRWNPIMERTKNYGNYCGSNSQRLSNGKTRKMANVFVKKEKTKSNIWKYQVGFQKTTKDIYAYEHPAMFPENLARDLIITWTNEGDLVFDPMMGSGTTGKMAMLLNRDFIGIEISKQYFQLVKKRIERNKSLFFAGKIKYVIN